MKYLEGDIFQIQDSLKEQFIVVSVPDEKLKVGPDEKVFVFLKLGSPFINHKLLSQNDLTMAEHVGNMEFIGHNEDMVKSYKKLRKLISDANFDKVFIPSHNQ